MSKYIDFSRFDQNQDGEIDGLEADTPAAFIEGAREKVILQRDGKGGVTQNYFSLLGNWKVRMKESDPDKANVIPVAELFMTRYAGVLQGNFGLSTRYGELALSVITERLPVSTTSDFLLF